MARITRPGQPSSGVTGSRLGTSTSITGASGIASTESQVGKAIQASATAYFNDANKAYQDSVYSNALSEATVAFNDMYQKRIDQREGKDGLPTFKSLPEDIGKIGTAIRTQVSMRIPDLQARRKFDSDFQKFATSKQVLALGEARKQSAQYAQVSLTKSTEALVQQAAEDSPANINGYLGRINDMVNNSLAEGVITPAQAESIKDTSRANVRMRSYSQMIDQNPAAAREELDKPLAELGLKADERDRLVRHAEAGMRDLQRQQESQQRELEKSLKEQQQLTKSEIELGILEGTAGEKHIEEALTTGKISPQQRLDLLKQIARTVNKNQKKDTDFVAVNAAVESGAPLISFTPKQVDNYYKDRVRAATPQNGQLSLPQRAALASDIKTNVTSLDKELTQEARFGTNSAEALAAYEYLSNLNPSAIQGLNVKDNSVLSLASTLSEGGMEPRQAMEMAREVVSNPNPDNVKEFRKLDIDYRELAQEALDNDPVFTSGPDLTTDTRRDIEAVYRSHYVLTGDKKAAEKAVEKHVRSVYQVSELGGNKIMRDAPEKVYAGLYTAEELAQDFQSTLQEALPGRDVADFYVGNPVYKSNTPSYPVLFEANGLEQQLFINGIPQFYRPETVERAKLKAITNEQERQRRFAEAEQNIEGSAEQNRRVLDQFLGPASGLIK